VGQQDRLRALREQPEQLGYTREEANALVAKAAASKLSDKHGTCAAVCLPGGVSRGQQG